MRTAKQDFIWLLQDELDEIRKLPQRFPLRSFNYMITSQRTPEQIYRKMKRVDEGKVPRGRKGNFWVDLRALGLASDDREELSELGKAALEYMRRVKSDFKREHFVLSGIRAQAYDVPDGVHEHYVERVRNLHDYLKRIPPLNKKGKEILLDEEKLAFTECLNTFPNALGRYFQLSKTRQRRLDYLRESGLKRLFKSRGTRPAA